MKFLKGMLGRPAEVLDRYGPGGAIEDLHEDEHEDWDETGSPEDGDSAVKEEPPKTGGDNVTELRGLPAPRQEPEEEASEDEEAEPERTPSRPDSMKIWELFDDDEGEDGETMEETKAGAPESKPAPVKEATSREMSERTMAREALAMIQARSPGALQAAEAAPVGRAKTRLIGFAGGDAPASELFRQVSKPADTGPNMFPVGWVIIIEGPGRGASFTLFSGLTQIGRSEDQTVALNFGDHAISRENHASIAYDDEENLFYLGHGGKANIVRLNGRPVLSTEDLSNGDLIRIGETTLRFVALCGTDFAWDLTDEDEED